MQTKIDRKELTRLTNNIWKFIIISEPVHILEGNKVLVVKVFGPLVRYKNLKHVKHYITQGKN